PWQPDTLYYQLTLPRLYLEQHGFVRLPQEPVVSAYPGLGQMLFAIAMAAGHDDLAALASWMHAALFVLGTYLLVRRVARSERAALLAAAVAGSLPQLAFIGSVALVDTITAAHLTLAAHATLRAGEDDADPRWAHLAALT